MLRILRAKKPRLVLLDLMLPGTDGVRLMQTVPELADLPVIFISGYGRDETIARALEAGADDYIVKPFSPTELVARIRAALRRPPPERRVSAEAGSYRHSPSAVARYHSAMFQSSLSPVFNRTPQSEPAWAVTRPRPVQPDAETGGDSRTEEGHGAAEEAPITCCPAVTSQRLPLHGIPRAGKHALCSSRFGPLGPGCPGYETRVAG